MSTEKPPLGELNMGEDAPVADSGEDERQQHAGHDEGDGVAVAGGAVPHALLGLVVERVRRPPEVIRQIDGDADHPRRKHGGSGVGVGEHRAVEAVPADVQVPVHGD